MALNLQKHIHPRHTKPIVLTCSLIALVAIATLTSSYSEDLTNSFARKVEFNLRKQWGKGPSLNPRIKIFGFDDAAVDLVQDNEIDLNTWTQVIKYLQRAKPKAIFIDKIFSFHNGNAKEAENFIMSIKKGAPVFVGSYVTPLKVGNRQLFPIEDVATFHYKNFIKDPDLRPLTIPWLVEKDAFLYGPHVMLYPAFAAFGHINEFNSGRVNPILSVYKEFLLPHLSMWAVDSMEVNMKGFKVNGKDVPLDNNSEILVNLVDPAYLYGKTMTLKPVIEFARKKQEKPSYINEGDIIIISEAMFTGHQDYTNSSFGKIPGFFIIVSMINSILNDNWFSYLGNPYAITAITFVILTALALYLPPIWLIVSNTLLLAMTLLIGFISFISYNVVFPWLIPSLQIIISTAAISAIRMYFDDKYSKMIKNSLSKNLSSKDVSNLINNPDSFKRESSQQVVTIMFIDMVGFSLSSEKMTPKQAFEELKDFLGLFKEAIHKHGGVVDRTLGDGLLCFFGYNYAIDSDPNDYRLHADQALACACEIQKACLIKCLENKDNGRPIYPVRIGINTAAVYIGDISKDELIDFTLIGHGVNYAKRLESSCSLFKVLLSGTTKDLLTNFTGTSQEFRLKKFNIKHHNESLTAYEFDPFSRDSEKLNAGLMAYKEYAGFERKEPRWLLPKDSPLQIKLPEGIDSTYDISLNGMAIVGKHFYANGTTINIGFESANPEFLKKLQVSYLTQLVVEVRWGREYKDGKYIHGLLFKSLNENQKKQLLSYVRDYISQQNDSQALKPVLTG